MKVNKNYKMSPENYTSTEQYSESSSWRNRIKSILRYGLVVGGFLTISYGFMNDAWQKHQIKAGVRKREELMTVLIGALSTKSNSPKHIHHLNANSAIKSERTILPPETVINGRIVPTSNVGRRDRIPLYGGGVRSN